MIKKILLALAVALPACAWAQAPKFGVVDVESIIPNMTEFKEAQDKINDASKTYESEYSKINEELQKKYAEYQELDKDPSTLQSIKERRMQDIQELDKKSPAICSNCSAGPPTSTVTAHATHPGKSAERH
jgi:outer membrane protein